MKAIKVVPLSFWERFLGLVLTPFMYVLSGTFKEKPQQTHFWNNRKLTPNEVGSLYLNKMVSCRGIKGESKRYLLGFIPLFHIPIFGGWRNYVVVEPKSVFCRDWYVGWICFDGAFGISRIKLRGPVRLLIGPDAVSFFVVEVKSGIQMPARRVDTGRVGDGDLFSSFPLL